MQNVVLGNLTGSWFDPDNILTVSKSDLTETSISTSIETSIGASFQGLSASIKKTTTTTHTQAQTLSIENSYDLTKYEQDKVYMVVLIGTISFCRLQIDIINDDGFSYSVAVPFVEVIVNQPYGEDSLRIKLIQKPK
jgi:hypothetical protein